MVIFNHRNSILRICVDNIRDGIISGRVLGCRLIKPMPFTDQAKLLLQLDELFRQQNFPQASQRARVFLPGSREESFAASPGEGISEDEVKQAAGTVATFELLVISRRNLGWQGMVNWLDGSERIKFSSCLELLRLMKDRFLVPHP